MTAQIVVIVLQVLILTVLIIGTIKINASRHELDEIFRPKISPPQTRDDVEVFYNGVWLLAWHGPLGWYIYIDQRNPIVGRSINIGHKDLNWREL